MPAAGETLSAKQMAAIIQRVTGQHVKLGTKIFERLGIELAVGPVDDLIRYRVIAARGKGTTWKKSDTFSAKKCFQNLKAEERISKSR